MGNTVIIDEIFDANHYNFADEVKIVESSFSKAGLTWKPQPEFTEDGVIFPSKLYGFEGIATGLYDPILQEKEGLIFSLYNLGKCEGNTPPVEDNYFPFYNQSYAKLFRNSMFIDELSYQYDKGLRFIYYYMQAKKERLPFVNFGWYLDYVSYEDVKKLYDYCKGDEQPIDEYLWFGEAWDEMLKTRKPYTVDDLSQWL